MELSNRLETSNVILLIDANQNIVNGHFNRKMNEIGLYNVFEAKVTHDIQILATHHRGSKPISAIYANTALSCTKCGILPKCVGVHGDHRNMFADFTAESFLGSSIYEVVTQPMKRLQLKDSRTVKKFLSVARKHLQSTSSFQYAEELMSEATYPPPDGFSSKMEKLDDQFGRAISAAKKKCRHCIANMIYFKCKYYTIQVEGVVHTCPN